MMILYFLLGVGSGLTLFTLGFCVGWTEGKARVRISDGAKMWAWLSQKEAEAKDQKAEAVYEEVIAMIGHWQLTGKVT